MRGDTVSAPVNPRDSLAARRELVRLVGHNDADGVRRLVYSGALDELESESYHIVRRAATTGDLEAIAHHFVEPLLALLRVAINGDAAAQTTLAVTPDIEWLNRVIPARDFKQLARRLQKHDTRWLQEQANSWPVARASDMPRQNDRLPDPAPPRAPLTPAPPPPPSLSAKPVDNPLSRADSPSMNALTRALFGDVEYVDFGEPPPIAGPRRRSRRRRRRFARIVVPLLVIALIAWVVYLMRQDRAERDSAQNSVRRAPEVTSVSSTSSPIATTTPTTAPTPGSGPSPPLGAVPPPDVLLFASNSTALGPGSDEVLNTVVQRVRADPTLSVSVVGYSDNVGPIAANRATSLRRAQVVRDALAARGIIVADVQGAGPDPTVDAARGRRVEVIYSRG